MDKFKVGDKVKIIDKYSSYCGELGYVASNDTVPRVEIRGGVYNREFVEGNMDDDVSKKYVSQLSNSYYFFEKDDLELVEESNEESEAKEEKIAVYTSTKEEYDELMELYEKVGWKWDAGQTPKEFGQDKYQKDDLIEFRNEFVFVGRIKKYSKKYYKIITLDEAKQRLQKMYPEKFKKEVELSPADDVDFSGNIDYISFSSDCLKISQGTPTRKNTKKETFSWFEYI